MRMDVVRQLGLTERALPRCLVASIYLTIPMSLSKLSTTSYLTFSDAER
jgi:hypothetical protein